MGSRLKNQGIWTIKRATSVCGEPKKPDTEIVERLKRRGWDLGPQHASIHVAMEEINKGEASLLILEHSSRLPAPIMLRQLIYYPMGFLVPTLILCEQKDAGEQSCFGSIGTPSIVESLDNPSIIVESFEFLVKRWSQDYMKPLVAAGIHYVRGNLQSCIKLLSELTKSPDPQLSLLAGPCLSLFLRKQSLKISEKVLLNLLETSQRNMGLLFSLIDLYQQSAMPSYALRLLKSASGMYNQPMTLVPDLIKTHLMLNQLEQTIPLFKKLKEEKFLSHWVDSFLPRILFASGYEREFHQMIRTRPKSNQAAYHSAWGVEQTNERAS